MYRRFLIVGSGALALASVGCVTAAVGFLAPKLVLSLARGPVEQLLAASIGDRRIPVPFGAGTALCGGGSCSIPVKPLLSSAIGASLPSNVNETLSLGSKDLGGLRALMDEAKAGHGSVEHSHGNGAVSCDGGACRLAYSLKQFDQGDLGASLSTVIASAVQSTGAARVAR